MDIQATKNTTSLAFEAAYNEFKGDAATEKLLDGGDISSLAELWLTFETLQKQQADRELFRNLGRLRPLIDGLEKYSKIVEVFVNAKPEILAFLWGPIKTCLLISSSIINAFQGLLAEYQRIGRFFQVLESIENLFQEHLIVQQVLVTVYRDILTFHLRCLRFFKKKGWRITFLFSTRTFEGLFSDVISNLEASHRLLRNISDIAHMEECQKAFHKLDLDRDEETARYQAAKEKVEEDRRFKVFDWLGAPSPSGYHELVRERRNDFGNHSDWIFDQQQSKAWMNSDDIYTTMWLTAILGAGKTYLFNGVIEHLRDLHKNDAHTKVVYCYCRYSDIDTNRFQAVAASLIMQLLGTNDHCLEYLYQQVLASGRPKISASAHWGDIFATLLNCYDKVFIGVDGLDECEPVERKLITSFLQYPTKKVERDCYTRIFISSCAEKDLERQLQGVQRFVITQDHLSPSINHYVSARLAKMNEKFHFKPKKLNDIASRVSARADGMFLLARLILDSVDDQITREDFEEELDNEHLPSGINEAYGRIVARIRKKPERAQKKIKRVFELLLTTPRPVQLHEVQGVISYKLEDYTMNFEKRMYVGDFKELCGPIVDVVGETIDLVHYTAKRYLAESASTFLSIENPHAMMACICSAYLSLEIFDSSQPSGAIVNAVETGEYAFHEYALSCWTQHMKTMHDQKEKILSPPADAQEIAVVLGQRFEVGLDLPEGASLRTLLDRVDETCARFNGYKDDRSPGILYHIIKVRKYIEQALEQPQLKASVLPHAYGVNFYKCNVFSCPYFQSGFGSKRQRESHVERHVCRFRCHHESCPFFSQGFASQKMLEDHLSWSHEGVEVSLRFPTLKPSSIWDTLREAIDLDDVTAVQKMLSGVQNFRGATNLIEYAINKKSFDAAWYLATVPAIARQERCLQGYGPKRSLPIQTTLTCGRFELTNLLLSKVKSVGFVRSLVISHGLAEAVSCNDCVAVRNIIVFITHGDPINTKGYIEEAYDAALKSLSGRNMYEMEDLLLDAHDVFRPTKRSFENAAKDVIGKNDLRLGRKILEVAEKVEGAFSKQLASVMPDGIDAMVRNLEERPSLSKAITRWDIKGTEVCLSNGADVNKILCGRGTAISVAIEAGNIDILRLVLESNARFTTDLLFEATERKSPEILQFLLDTHFANVDVSQIRHSIRHDHLLQRAVETGSPTTVSFLLRRGADPLVVSADQETLLHFVARSIAFQLHYAVTVNEEKVKENLRLFTLLINSGLEVMAKDSEGLTPLMKQWRLSPKGSFYRSSQTLFLAATRCILEHYPSAEAKEQELRELARIAQGLEGLAGRNNYFLEGVLRDLGENLRDQEPLDEIPETVDTGHVSLEVVDASDPGDNENNDDDEMTNKRKRLDDSTKDPDGMDLDTPVSQQKRTKIEHKP